MIKTFIINSLTAIGISSPKSALIGGAIVFVLYKLFEHVVDDLWEYCKNFKIGKNFSWTPDKPIRNTGEFKDIKDYPKDLEWNLDNNSLDMKTLVSGEKSFIQSLAKFIYTERNKYCIYSKNYGNEQAETIFIEKSPLEFNRQCHYMVETIMSNENLKNYIQELYKIERKGNDLYIEMKVYGKPETLTCKIPYIKVGNKA